LTIEISNYYRSFDDIYNYYGAFNYNLTENIIQNIDLMVLLSNGKHALKGAFITKWYINPKHTLNFIISNTQRLVEEDNSLWYWSKLGYGLINTDFTINGNLNKSKTFTTDLIWKNKINDKLTIEISNYYRSFDDIYLEQQYYSFNPEDGSFTSSPLIIHTNQEGVVIGANCAIKSNINSIIYQYLYYDYQSELSSKDVFKDVMKTIPKHSLDYQLMFSPIQNFSIWTKFSYISSSQWGNYKNINGESYLTIHQDTLKYSNKVGSSNVIDLGIQKWLFKRKINTNLFFRNVFNQKIRYHPIGASFDLTLYFHITYYPFKNY
jgi:outer membrane receptor for ferrienterochelin and colicin